MEREAILQELQQTGIVAVVRVSDGKELTQICQALAEGGLKGIEITMTSPGALKAIEEARNRLGDDIYIGAGSVLDTETARQAILSGAHFLVSPILNEGLIKMGRSYSTLVIPGAFTPTEIFTAWQTGADVVKVFPATRLGPSFFKDVQGPLPQIRMIPTGGVDEENMNDFFQAGAPFVCMGSALLQKELIQKGDWNGVTARTRNVLNKVGRW